MENSKKTKKTSGQQTRRWKERREAQSRKPRRGEGFTGLMVDATSPNRLVVHQMRTWLSIVGQYHLHAAAKVDYEQCSSKVDFRSWRLRFNRSRKAIATCSSSSDHRYGVHDEHLLAEKKDKKKRKKKRKKQQEKLKSMQADDDSEEDFSLLDDEDERKGWGYQCNGRINLVVYVHKYKS